jgi:CRISPR-associated protein Cas2
MDKERLVARVLKCIDEDEDSLRIYRLSEPRRRNLEVYGLDHYVDFKKPLVA